MDPEAYEICAASCTSSGHVWGTSHRGILKEYQPLGDGFPCTLLRTIAPVSSLGFKVKQLCVHADETFAVVIGGDVPETGACLGVVDLRDGKSGRKGYGIPNQYLLLNCPGVSVKKFRWVPGSANHFAVLASNNRWAVFDARNPQVAVQTYKLEFSTPAGWVRTSGAAVSFDFCPRVAWGHFSVVFLRNDHSVFLVCPVVVPGMWVSKRVRTGLRVGKEAGIQKWCAEVFQNRAGEMLVTGELPDWWTEEPALQGPLNNNLPAYKHRTQDPGADIRVASCHGLTIVYIITARGVVSASVLDGDIQPKLESQLFAFDIHRPMLAPQVVLRQASAAVGLITVSEAVLGKNHSDVLEFLSHSIEDDLDQVLGVVRANGVFIIQNPALKVCVEGIQFRSDVRDMQREIKPPLIRSISESAPGRNSKAIAGYFKKNTFYVVYSQGEDLVVTYHTIDELPTPLSMQGSGLCARKLNFDSPDVPRSKDTLRSSLSSLPTVEEDSDSSIADVIYNMERVVKFLDENFGNQDEKLSSVYTVSKVLCQSVRELDDQSTDCSGIKEALDQASKNALPLSQALANKLRELDTLPISHVEGRNLDEGMSYFVQHVNRLKQDVETIVHSCGQQR